MSKQTGYALVADLESAFGRPDPADWQTQYTPTEAVAYAAEVADLEDQLDLGWPEWRNRKPFVSLKHDKVAWIKERLLRRQLILDGSGDHGVRVVRRPKDEYPMAVPVRPTKRRDVDRAAYRPLVSTPLLSTRLGMPLALIEELIPRMPDGVRDVRSWLVGERGRAAADPLPATSAPLSDLVSSKLAAFEAGMRQVPNITAAEARAFADQHVANRVAEDDSVRADGGES